MNLYHNIDDIDYNKIFFYKPVINKIIHYNYFYKLIYDINIFTLNTLIIHIDIDSYELIEENGKFRAHVKINQSFIEKIKLLEEHILKNISKKQHVLSCYKFLVFNKNNYMFDKYPEKIKLALRISGLWETETSIGLTTKIYVNDYPSTNPNYLNNMNHIVNPSTVKLSNTTC
jgi:hypothetical protein